MCPEGIGKEQQGTGEHDCGASWVERLSIAATVEDVLAVLAEPAMRLGPWHGLMFAIADAEGNYLVCRHIHLPAGYESMRETYHDFRIPIDSDDVAAVVYRNQAPRVVTATNAELFSPITRTRFQRWRAESLLAVPVVADGKPLGAVVFFNQEAVIDDGAAAPALDFLARFSGQIRRASAYTAMSEREALVREAATGQKAFLEFITQVNEVTRREAVYELVADRLLDLSGFDLAAVLMEEAGHLTVRAVACTKDDHRPIAEAIHRLLTDDPFELDAAAGASPMVLKQDRHFFFPDVQKVRDLPMSRRDRLLLDTMRAPRSFLLLPLRSRGRPIGVLWLVTLEEPKALSMDEQAFYELIGSFLGTAVGNAELYQVVDDQRREIETLNADLRRRVVELGQIATTDQLTGLYNFGHLQVELERRVSEYERRPRGDELALVIIDVDHFKAFNDRFGHLAGNHVLQGVAARLRALSRSMDVPCRYGGEEFVVILPKCGAQGARDFGERVRSDIASRRFCADTDIPVTVSVGYSVYRWDEDAGSFLQRADDALYRAKQKGRDRVEAAID